MSCRKIEPSLLEKATRLPAVPGIYQFRVKDEIIYIGKAKVLKERIRAYFNPSNQDPKVNAIVTHADDLIWIVTDSEVEALILENTLIKKHKPKYNIDLKENKRYPFIKVTLLESFPRMEVVWTIEKDGARYFGPYVDHGGMQRVLRILESVFQLRNCKTSLPLPEGKRPCLNFQIAKCQGLCFGRISSADYRERVKNALLFLSGKNRELLATLEKEMRAASSAQQFEEAARLRDQMSALQGLIHKQRMTFGDIPDRDIISLAREGRECCVALFQVRDKAVIGRYHAFLSLFGNETDGELIASFIQSHYQAEMDIPPEIMTDVAVSESDVLESYLSKEAERRVRLCVPQKGEKARLIELVRKNADLLMQDYLIQKGRREREVPAALLALKKDLHLTGLPNRIEAYDISHHGGEETVASQVTFVNGKSRKSDYRKYIIRTVTGVDDFASLREVIQRRVRRAKEENDPLPDLLLIDGGKGQLSAVYRVLQEVGFANQAVASLAKRFEEVFVPGLSEPLMIPKRSPAIHLLQRIRDEAHRFAVTFHRARKGKKMITRSSSQTLS